MILKLSGHLQYLHMSRIQRGCGQSQMKLNTGVELKFISTPSRQTVVSGFIFKALKEHDKYLKNTFLHLMFKLMIWTQERQKVKAKGHKN